MRRKCLAEFIGAFVIVFAPVALSGASHLNGGDSTLIAAAWVSGLPVIAMIYSLGNISSAHFNPAVTIALATIKRFEISAVLPYVASQMLGGIAAATACTTIFGAGSGAHIPTNALAALAFEVILTGILMFVIMAVGVHQKAGPTLPGVIIGLVVVMNVWIGGPVSGGSMNPARSFGPVLFSERAALSSYWVYMSGPILGAMAAAVIYEALFNTPYEN